MNVKEQARNRQSSTRRAVRTERRPSRAFLFILCLFAFALFRVLIGASIGSLAFPAVAVGVAAILECLRKLSGSTVRRGQSPPTRAPKGGQAR